MLIHNGTHTEFNSIYLNPKDYCNGCVFASVGSSDCLVERGRSLSVLRVTQNLAVPVKNPQRESTVKAVSAPPVKIEGIAVKSNRFLDQKPRSSPEPREWEASVCTLADIDLKELLFKNIFFWHSLDKSCSCAVTLNLYGDFLSDKNLNFVLVLLRLTYWCPWDFNARSATCASCKCRLHSPNKYRNVRWITVYRKKSSLYIFAPYRLLRYQVVLHKRMGWQVNMQIHKHSTQVTLTSSNVFIYLFIYSHSVNSFVNVFK